uniref:Uncharacterized protein n=1 Tax=Medicago truncatula TaxID=3880 RepID=I3T2W7_MEDTR|nr:unknown [Medicago truncatula]
MTLSNVVPMKPTLPSFNKCFQMDTLLLLITWSHLLNEKEQLKGFS